VLLRNFPQGVARLHGVGSAFRGGSGLYGRLIPFRDLRRRRDRISFRSGHGHIVLNRVDPGCGGQDIEDFLPVVLVGNFAGNGDRGRSKSKMQSTGVKTRIPQKLAGAGGDVTFAFVPGTESILD
jgi:hypothetical protein